VLQDFRYRDALAQKRRHDFLARITKIGVLAGLILAGLVSLVFFSPFFAVTDIAVQGLEKHNKETITGHIKFHLDKNPFRALVLANNMLFLDADELAQQLRAEFPLIRDVSVEKDWLHALRFSFIEREPLGAWCFKNECTFFDVDGMTWGQTVRSSGFLLTTVVDLREHEEKKIEPLFLEAVKIIDPALKNMNVGIKEIIIPADTLPELHVATTNGYDIYFAVDGKLAAQLNILRIFLDAKRLDPAFHPQYLDARIEGRVYYR